MCLSKFIKIQFPTRDYIVKVTKM